MELQFGLPAYLDEGGNILLGVRMKYGYQIPLKLEGRVDLIIDSEMLD
jgi:hypothetical protein